jgi:hypothetical protein
MVFELVIFSPLHPNQFRCQHRETSMTRRDHGRLGRQPEPGSAMEAPEHSL